MAHKKAQNSKCWRRQKGYTAKKKKCLIQEQIYKPNAAPQTNVGHRFHWEQSGHQEDEPHFQSANTIQGKQKRQAVAGSFMGNILQSGSPQNV